MRMIFEHVDGIDYLELILLPKEIEKLSEGNKFSGVKKEFPAGMLNKHKLNVFIRQESDLEVLEEEEDAISQRKVKESDFREYKRAVPFGIPSKTSNSHSFKLRKKIGGKHS